MTARRKEPGDLEIVQFGLGTKSFRVALLILVVSMHPLGRQMLATFGFEFPDQRKLTVATEESKTVTSDIKVLKDDVKELKDNMVQTKSDTAVINQKLDGLQRTFTGFTIDFDKYRPHKEETKPNP